MVIYGLIQRREQESRNTQLLEVTQFLFETLQITVAITIAIIETALEHVVYDFIGGRCINWCRRVLVAGCAQEDSARQA